MLKPQVFQESQSPSAKTQLCSLPKAFIHGGSNLASFPVCIRPSIIFPCSKKHRNHGLSFSSSNVVRALLKENKVAHEKIIKVKAVVTVSSTVGGFLSNIGLSRGLDDIQDLLGKTLLLELVSAELEPKTGLEKKTVTGYAHRSGRRDDGGVEYEADLDVSLDFGMVGAIVVENEHHKEMFIKNIVLEGFPNGPVNVSCNSWVHSKFDNAQKRIFFTNKSYLPSQTPGGLKNLREKDLKSVRGDGEGKRKSFERIYDYDVYNDLGNPDKSDDLKRPVLGGKERPYPRRCRTGRPRTKNDPLSEERSGNVYVPRDEAFSEIKQLTFSAKTVYSGLHALVPSLQTVLLDPSLGFPYFKAIDSLFDDGLKLPPTEDQGLLKNLLPRLVKTVSDANDALQFEIPETLDRDKFFWFRDEEFGRQTLAGLNPYSIQLVKEWPLKSKLDPEIYGPPESAITAELIEREIKGFMTIDEAIKQKKLFILDYHDLLLPYVKKVREIEGTTLYGSRTLFFLTLEGTLRPLAIELTRPPMDGKPQWKEVFSPSWHATGVWLWRFAKAHVLAHDSGYHQLVSHWLRTHCATEPYIIATNRQLSAMHPIYRLLHPHFRYTMEINALAREALINAGGIIESAFTPGKYSMELCADAYDQLWRFDQEALPADLINRGMAVEDPSAPHGLKLTIEDYPFANDGLILWDIIKQWVTDYVNYYYPEPDLVESDQELQSWWTEIRTVGHGDKKDEPWWPVLKTPKDLIEILTTIVWVTSGHHAAVNFGQYTYAGYFPNRPTIARTNMPTEDASELFWENFWAKPEEALLQCFPSQIQATTIMAVLDILSNHSPDEEYLGEKIEPSWEEDDVIKAAFERFHGRLKELEGIIDERNTNKNLKNRCGVGVVPYQLLKPFSEPGVTGKGVPYSISI
ncbi:linoleate 13S-lipoxygenase 2-1, chloroplastic-like [Humulus lupulus]|uniref:linoleate 13S-lipoxygenase 2-1, chloroplastic-like n=1 Tax=Humulus lupulus TaxID=3486 RepID=UPI002B4112D2|nr:linoleate 13S-lipoxygenase 2-1, chloroplastic-like [Humulus lupulus]